MMDNLSILINIFHWFDVFFVCFVDLLPLLLLLLLIMLFFFFFFFFSDDDDDDVLTSLRMVPFTADTDDDDEL